MNTAGYDDDECKIQDQNDNAQQKALVLNLIGFQFLCISDTS